MALDIDKWQDTLGLYGNSKCQVISSVQKKSSLTALKGLLCSIR